MEEIWTVERLEKFEGSWVCCETEHPQYGYDDTSSRFFAFVSKSRVVDHYEIIRLCENPTGNSVVLHVPESDMQSFGLRVSFATKEDIVWIRGELDEGATIVAPNWDIASVTLPRAHRALGDAAIEAKA